MLYVEDYLSRIWSPQGGKLEDDSLLKAEKFQRAKEHLK